MRKNVENGFKTIKIKTFPINKTPTFLVIKKQKYLCNPSADCPQTITKIVEVKGVQPKHRIANSINENIMIDFTRNCSIKDIAQDNNVFSNTVFCKLYYLRTLMLTVTDVLGRSVLMILSLEMLS